MKPFKINRNSWHYKLNKNFMNSHGFDLAMIYNWEPRHSDFCSYWRATIIRLIAAIFTAVFVLFLVAALGFAVYLHPYETLKIVGSVITFFSFVFACIAAMVYFDESKKKMEQSLFVQKYRAHKAKICPMVEYE